MQLEELHSIFISLGQNVSTDTRKIIPGSIFFALKGENFNGNDFALEALNRGASVSVVDDPNLDQKEGLFFVKDVLTALQKLANFHRRKFDIPILAITGSNGKTTTKELLTAVLKKKYNTLSTEGNLNNHIGVPLTLLKLRENHEFAVIEMGANHQGEIQALCEIAEPNFGIITNIGKAHLEGFGGIEGVKKGKSELFKYLAERKGKVFIHGDDAVLQEVAVNMDRITYGTTKLFDVIGKINHNSKTVEFAWKTRYTASEIKSASNIKTNLVGIYNYFNVLCSACVGNYFKITENEINEAIANYNPDNNRSQLKKTEKNTLICDYYNANPTSMRAAIENFKKSNFENRFLILGDMLELGEETEKEHQDILNILNEFCLSDYLLVGPVFYALNPEKSFINSELVVEFIKEKSLEGKTILIKGSRGIMLEKIIPYL